DVPVRVRLHFLAASAKRREVLEGALARIEEVWSHPNRNIFFHTEKTRLENMEKGIRTALAKGSDGAIVDLAFGLAAEANGIDPQEANDLCDLAKAMLKP